MDKNEKLPPREVDTAGGKTLTLGTVAKNLADYLSTYPEARDCPLLITLGGKLTPLQKVTNIGGRLITQRVSDVSLGDANVCAGLVVGVPRGLAPKLTPVDRIVLKRRAEDHRNAGRHEHADQIDDILAQAGSASV